MNTHDVVLQHLAETVTEFSPLPFPDDVTDETSLDEFWLDSIAFVTLLSSLEEALGFIPQAVIRGEFQPQTVGDLVGLYTAQQETD